MANKTFNLMFKVILLIGRKEREKRNNSFTFFFPMSLLVWPPAHNFICTKLCFLLQGINKPTQNPMFLFLSQGN